MDRQIIKNIKESEMDLEGVRQQLMSTIQAKADYRDIDNLSQKLHAKVDFDKVQAMVMEIRQEVSNALSLSKKDSQTSLKKKDDHLKALKDQIEQSCIQNGKEVQSLQEKLQRLAAQFDKELMTRDKQIKQFKNMSQEDVQRGLAQLNTEIEITRKQLNEIEVRKADKRDLLDQK